MKKKGFFALLGAVTGAANGLFGSGGGVIAVPMLEKAGLEAKKSHATSLALTLPLSVVSVIFYAAENTVDLVQAVKLVPYGIAGAALGCAFLKKIPTKALKRIFGVMLIVAGGRMIFS